MKKIFLFSLFIILSGVVWAQTNPVLINENLGLLDDEEDIPPQMVFFSGNLYFSVYRQGKIVKLKSDIPNAPIEEVATGLHYVTDLFIDGSNLYFTEFADAGFSENSGKLSKINLSASTPVVEVLAENLKFPYSLAVKENTVYLIELDLDNIIDDEDFEFNGSALVRFNVNHPEDRILMDEYDFATDLQTKQAEELCLIELYSSNGEDYEDSKIWRYNLNDHSRVLFYQDSYVFTDNFTVKDNRLYASFDAYGDIASLDLSVENPVPQIIVEEDQFFYDGIPAYPVLLSISTDNNLFTLAYFDMYDENDEFLYTKNLLFKVSLDEMNTAETGLSDLCIYPNPVTDIVTLGNIDSFGKINVNVYDMVGKLVMSKTLTEKKEIDLSHLKFGVYLMQLLNTSNKIITTKKVIKK